MTRPLWKACETVCLAGLNRHCWLMSGRRRFTCWHHSNSPYLLPRHQSERWPESESGKPPVKQLVAEGSSYLWPDHPYRRPLYRCLQSDQRDADGRFGTVIYREHAPL
jgi:hypothetical protein